MTGNTFERDMTTSRRMLSEKQVLQIVPVSAVTLWRMRRQAGFRDRLTSVRTGGSGTRTRSSRGKTKSMAGDVAAHTTPAARNPEHAARTSCGAHR